jgi:hypothetical protein
MKNMKRVFPATVLLGLLVLAAPSAHAQFTYTTNVGGITITITGYTGAGGAVTIPTNINGLRVSSIGYSAFIHCTNLSSVTIPDSVTSIEGEAFYGCTSLASVTIRTSVSSIGYSAFLDCTNLSSVTIPDSVTSIEGEAFYACTSLASVTIPTSVTNMGEAAFSGCHNLRNVFFTGNAPGAGWGLFDSDPATVYYLPGTAGWGDFAATIGEPYLRVVLWNPLIQARGADFGIRSNQFGFNITGTTNIPIVVEACANLANPVWTPLQTLTLTNGLFYFSEPVQTNSSGRYYRISSP